MPNSTAAQATRLTGSAGEPALLVRHRPGPGPSLLYVHGATFPSALSVAYPIAGRSWMDDLGARGFDTWAFDFAGYGGSDRPAAMRAPAAAAPPFGRARDAAGQIERVARHVQERSGRQSLSILAHSWGTIPAGVFAARRSEWLDRLVLFGPIAMRQGVSNRLPRGGSRPVSVADQWRSFQSGLPAGQASLIAPTLFELWAEAYLASDPEGGAPERRVVMVPVGPGADLAEAWSGRFPYDPAAVRTPTLIVRGEWDALATDADAAWLVQSLSSVPGGAADVKLPRGGHRMHLEENRQALFDAVGAFLSEPAREAAR